MQSQFLQKRYLSRPEEDHLYHRGRIKITSPDQFVPLFLANYGKEAFGSITSTGSLTSPITMDSSKVITISSGTRNSLVNMLVTSASKNDTVKRKVYKETIMGDVKKILNSPLPTEYSFIDPRGLSSGNYGTNTSYSFEYFVSMANHLAMVSSDYRFLSALGLLCEVSSVSRASGRSSMYPSFNYTLPSHEIEPQVVILVKYKHLAKARAALFLQTSIDVSHDELKLVRVQSFSNSHISELYRTKIHPMCLESGMNIEYVPKEVLSSYLFPSPVKKTKEQCIADAIKSLTVIEPHVVF